MAGISIDAMIKAIRARGSGAGGTGGEAEAARAGAEQIARKLPSAVMPMQAIDEDRRRKAQMDQMLRDASR